MKTFFRWILSLFKRRVADAQSFGDVPHLSAEVLDAIARAQVAHLYRLETREQARQRKLAADVVAFFAQRPRPWRPSQYRSKPGGAK